MDWKTFAVSLATALAWPTVVMILGVLYRFQIVALFDRLKSVKVPGSELTFTDGLATVEAQVESFRETEDPAVAEAVERAADSERLAGEDGQDEKQSSIDPSGTVIRNWEDLSRAVINLRSSTAGPGRPSYNVQTVLSQLVRDGIVNDLFAESVLGLQRLRNRVAHGEDMPNPGAALVYARRADELRRAANAMAEARRRAQPK